MFARDPFYRGEALVKLSSVIAWNILANIGRSQIMKLTVLAPLVGTFLLFNANTVSLFNFDATFLRDIGIHPADGSTNIFTTVNMYYLYFGLCFLGFGSFLFTLFCPEEIKSEPYIMRYIAGVEWADNAVVAKSKLQFVLDAYFANSRNVEADSLPPNPEYPNEVETDFYNLIFEMFQATDFGDVTDEPLSSAEDSPTVMESLVLPTGYPDIHEIARMVWSSPKVIWAFTMPFKNLSQKFAKDIAYVMFKTLSHDQFQTRCVIAVSYLIGFMLLLKPTMETFTRLAINAFF